MRTKTLILAAVLSAAGAATSLAQVYSVNMVGYINLKINPGFSMIANQLKATPDNKITTLFGTALPNNSAIFKFTGTGYAVDSFIDGAWEGDDLNMTLNPGEGVFSYIPGTTAYTNTFVGEVSVGTTANPIPAGFSVRSSVIPQSLPLTGAPPAGLDYPIGNNDSVYQFTGTGYRVNSYIDGAWEGDNNGQPPVPAIGESFFVFNAGAAKTWTRNFSVN